MKKLLGILGLAIFAASLVACDNGPKPKEYYAVRSISFESDVICIFPIDQYSFYVSPRNITVVVDPSRDGTYTDFLADGRLGSIFAPRATLYVRTPEQKQEWDKVLSERKKKLYSPRDVQPPKS